METSVPQTASPEIDKIIHTHLQELPVLAETAYKAISKSQKRTFEITESKEGTAHRLPNGIIAVTHSGGPAGEAEALKALVSSPFQIIGREEGVVIAKAIEKAEKKRRGKGTRL